MIARGCVRAVRGGLVHVRFPLATVGDAVRIDLGGREICGSVEAVVDGIAIVAPFDAVDGVFVGATVRSDPDAPPPCRVPDAGQRAPIDVPMWTGVRAIDGFLTIGRGARVGIFGPPGSGKSSLVRAIVANARADAVVVAAIGERGREAREWMDLADARTQVVCATSDLPAARRVRTAQESFALADRLRARGLHVLVLFDSLARYATALRELGVAAGESVGRGGFPPSVFARLARTLEMAGATRGGSISVVATVLDDGDTRDPISDAARSLLDGHIALSASLARAGHFPAIDVPASVSRTMSAVISPDHAVDATSVRSALAWLEETREARSLGLSAVGEQALRVLEAQPAIQTFLRQGAAGSPPAATLAGLRQIADSLR